MNADPILRLNKLTTMESEINTNHADLRTFWMLVAAMAFAGAGGGFEVPLVVKITGFYGISDSIFGLMLGLTTVVMGVASVPWGYWTDRYRRIKLLIISMGFIFACMLTLALCLQLRLPFWMFFTVNLLWGFGLAGIGPITASMAMDSVPLPQRGAAFGWFGVAFGGGGALGMLMASGCMQLHLSLALTYLLAAIVQGIFFLALFSFAEPRRGVQDEALHDALRAGQGEYNYAIEPHDLKMLVQKPINLLLAITGVFAGFTPAVLMIWFVTFAMRNHGLSELAATVLTLVAFAGQPVGSVVGGVLADRAYRWKRTGRVAVMFLTAALAPVFLIAAFALPFRLFPFVPLMILTNFFITAGAPAATAISLEVNLPEHRGTITAFYIICGSLSLGLAWLIPPLIAEAFGGQYQYAMIMSTAAYLPLIITYFLINSRIEKDLDHVNSILGERAKQIQNHARAGRSE